MRRFVRANAAGLPTISRRLSSPCSSAGREPEGPKASAYRLARGPLPVTPRTTARSLLPSPGTSASVPANAPTRPRSVVGAPAHVGVEILAPRSSRSIALSVLGPAVGKGKKRLLPVARMPVVNRSIRSSTEWTRSAFLAVSGHRDRKWNRRTGAAGEIPAEPRYHTRVRAVVAIEIALRADPDLRIVHGVGAADASIRRDAAADDVAGDRHGHLPERREVEGKQAAAARRSPDHRADHPGGERGALVRQRIGAQIEVAREDEQRFARRPFRARRPRDSG